MIKYRNAIVGIYLLRGDVIKIYIVDTVF